MMSRSLREPITHLSPGGRTTLGHVPASTRSAQARRTGESLIALALILERIYERTARRFGLTTQQVELICAVERPVATSHLAAALGCDRSNVTRLVDRAAERGLVTRAADAADGRVRLIGLTAEGHEIADAFSRAIVDELATMVGGLDPATLDDAARVVDALVEVLGADGARRG